MNKICLLFGHAWDLRNFAEIESWRDNLLKFEQLKDWRCLRCKITATTHNHNQEKPLVFKISKLYFWIAKKYWYYSFKIKKIF
ncbi:hypothetical protein KJ671_00655 [Patescibacteria group bacterium]|nr:hypothetical protein [Patescibacteria group bacterium]